MSDISLYFSRRLKKAIAVGTVASRLVSFIILLFVFLNVIKMLGTEVFLELAKMSRIKVTVTFLILACPLLSVWKITVMLVTNGNWTVF